MSKNRVKTNFVHLQGNIVHNVSREKSTGKLFIKNTIVEVTNKVIHRNQLNKNKTYDFSKPYQAQDLGDEWDDYAWSADDF